jgi:threonine dehydratase/peptide deformylase
MDRQWIDGIDIRPDNRFKVFLNLLSIRATNRSDFVTSTQTPLPILVKGHPDLQRPSRAVLWPDPELPEQIAALHATLRDFHDRCGFGRAISAVQAGICKRLIVMDLGAGPIALINPVITWRSEATWELWDDCLSVPDHLVRVRRHQSISVHYTDKIGRSWHWQHLPLDLAELIQHEMDHLDGILMDVRAVAAAAIRPIAEREALVAPQLQRRRLSLGRIRQAAQVISSEFLNSPQYDCEPLSEALGCTLTVKLEYANPIGSFKGRGASFLLHERLRHGELRPLVCASAGNWGQAMAYLCRSHGLPLVVYAAKNANALKVARMRAFGAEVRLAGNDFDAAKAAAKLHAARIGGWMVEDGLEPEISEGHGSIAMELLARGAVYDAVVVPLGNGALLAGVARWIKAASPATRVLGVCAASAPAMELSWRSGTVCSTVTAATIADGIAVREPVPEALDDLKGLVDDVLLVSDDHILEAMFLACRHGAMLVEPAGAAGLAGIWAHRQQFAGKRVATVLCGSNVMPHQILEIARAL